MDEIVVSRYSEAFMQYVKETMDVKNGVDELLALRQILVDNPQLREFLESPDFGEKEKFVVVDKVAADNFSAPISHLLKLLIVKDRINCLTGITEYVRRNYGQGDTVSAVLASAFAIDDDLVIKIKERLEKRINRRINLYVTYDSDLLGGAKVTIGNTVFDGTLRRQLAELREKAINWRTE